MPWDDATELETRLNRALKYFDWDEVDAVCDEIIRRVADDAELLPEPSARRLLRALQRKSRFRNMSRLAGALLQSGLRTSEVRRRYAQSLIDQGMLFEAEEALRAIIRDPATVKREAAEAKGLLGRVFKQLYVNGGDAPSARKRANLESALKEYLEGYRLDPYENYWHGINVVALTERARRDGVLPDGLPDARSLAEEILATLDKREAEGEKVYAFDEATRMEAYVALGHHQKALHTARRYLDSPDADAFELQSTIRQLRQVWQLKEDEPPGDLLLPLLSYAHLDAVGGAFELVASEAGREAAAAARAAADSGFEALLGPTRMKTFHWYKKGLEQCGAVARIEERGGRGHGTGWLVRAEDFFPGWTGVLVLTNSHVVSDPENPFSILPVNAQVHFQAHGEVYDVEGIVWQSPPKELDASFLRLAGEGVPTPKPLEIHKLPVAATDPPPRMYIIGHPAGRDLELSLQDNLLVACNERLVHYRTPTEPGSSGSPVFEPDDWRVVALHHKGSKNMKRLDGQGAYEANEGISIKAIQAETSKAGLPPPATEPGGKPRKKEAVSPPA